MPRVLVLVLLATTVLAAAPAASAAAPRAPKSFHGVMWDRAVAHASPASQEAQWRLMRRSGVDSVRLVFSWAHAQPQPGMPPDFSETDGYVERATRHRVALLPVVLNTPEWAKRFPGRFGSPPAKPGHYAAYLRALVERYGPRGSFWDERPELPRRPIRDWQIWNEPHFDFYWYTPRTGAWAKQYVALLRRARGAVKSVDRGARIVLAGFADASWRVLAQAYRAGVRGKFDVATINIFTGRPGFVMAATRLTRRVLKRYREPRKPIWVTETTFPAAKGLVPVPATSWQRQWYTTQRGMAMRLAELYALGALNARRLGLGRIYWYTWGSSYSGRGDLFDYSGLVRVRDSGISARPALRAFRRSALR